MPTPKPQGDEKIPGLAEWMCRRRQSARMTRTLSKPQHEGDYVAAETKATTPGTAWGTCGGAG